MDAAGYTLSVSQGVAALTLDRPQVMNALDGALIAGLIDALARVKADPAARVLLLTGNGRAFCAGADLRDPMMGVGLAPEERGRRFLESSESGINALARAMDSLAKPRVVAVNGAAVGGGCALALMGDIVVAARSAYFQMPFTSQLGLVPDVGGSWQLMRRAGPARAMGAVLLGERIAGPQAMDWGLVWQCVEDGQLMDTARGIAERLAQGAPRAQAALPGLMQQALANDLNAQLEAERQAQALLVQTQDFMEAVNAFREKRPPKFTGQ